MSDRKRYGNPAKEQEYEEAQREGGRSTAQREGGRSAAPREGRSKGELSVGFIFFAWILFFVLWLAAGSLLVAALVFGVVLTGAMAVLNHR